jgi:MFS family permease
MILQFAKYRRVFGNPSFRSFWLGFTLSVMGDAMSRVALTWYVYDLTRSARALALFTLAYTGPVILGGLMAGWLLDRFDLRKVMLIDNLVRGSTVLLIPILYASGRLELWHIYGVAAVYGSLMMIPLAGGPSLIPSLVKSQRLDTANALETLSFTLSGVIGPPVAGYLIPKIGAPNVILVDAVSYFGFAAALIGIRSYRRGASEVEPSRTGNFSLMHAVRLLISNRILLSTTLMFMAFNLGLGLMTVWLPIYSDQVAGGGSQLYGTLLGVMALGEIISASIAGSLLLSKPIGLLISLAQLASGIALGMLLFSLRLWWLASGLLLLGFFSAPLTIWAQTLRMQIIPEDMRGRTFALLRTLMQGTYPLGGAVAGVLLPALGIYSVIALSAAIIGAPGVVGLKVKELATAGRERRS